MKRPWKVAYTKGNKQRIASFSTQRAALAFMDKLERKGKIFKSWKER